MIARTTGKRRLCALFTTLSFVLAMALDQTANQPKPYVSIRELSALTPWTEQAIRTMMAKGIMREGEHFFHVGRRPVFKWEAIVGFIEHRDAPHHAGIPLQRGGFLNGAS
jgi:hypothetical protein